VQAPLPDFGFDMATGVVTHAARVGGSLHVPLQPPPPHAGGAPEPAPAPAPAAPLSAASGIASMRASTSASISASARPQSVTTSDLNSGWHAGQLDLSAMMMRGPISLGALFCSEPYAAATAASTAAASVAAASVGKGLWATSSTVGLAGPGRRLGRSARRAPAASSCRRSSSGRCRRRADNVATSYITEPYSLYII